MAKLTRKPAKKKNAVRRAYAKLENKLMAVAGRRAVRSTARKAAKAALIAGSLAAAKVVLDEVRERRRHRNKSL